MLHALHFAFNVDLPYLWDWQAYIQRQQAPSTRSSPIPNLLASETREAQSCASLKSKSHDKEVLMVSLCLCAIIKRKCNLVQIVANPKVLENDARKNKR
jgi:hypothetical protein